MEQLFTLTSWSRLVSLQHLGLQVLLSQLKEFKWKEPDGAPGLKSMAAHEAMHVITSGDVSETSARFQTTKGETAELNTHINIPNMQKA